MGIVRLMVSRHKWDKGIASSARRFDCSWGLDVVVLYC